MQFDAYLDVANSPSLGNLTSDQGYMVGLVMTAAANIWSHYLTTANVTLEIAISVNDAYYSGNVLAQGGPELYQQTGATYKGKPVYDTNTAIKLRTGTDINGDAPDIAIQLTSNAIKNLLSFKTDDTAAAASGRADALSVFLHEIGHGLGILDASEGGGFPGYGVYDTFVQNGKFFGPNTQRQLGGIDGIALQPGSLSHISESGIYANDLMSAAIPNGVNTHISDLDLAILQDIGLPVRTVSNGDDDIYATYGSFGTTDLHLMAGNDIGHAVAGGSRLYGDDGDDTLYGDLSSDTLSGGAGNDRLIGGGGSDILDGGDGIDVAVYSGAASNYEVQRVSNNAFRVMDLRSGMPDGYDTMTDVEVLQFSDTSYSNILAALPTVTTNTVVGRTNSSLAASSLFTASDPAGLAMTRYQFIDNVFSGNSGYFTLNGVRQFRDTVIEISAAQLSQLNFVVGLDGNRLRMRAFDGIAWSAPSDTSQWTAFNVEPAPNRAPFVTTANQTATKGQVLAASSLFSISDPDGDAMTRYQFWDDSNDPASGYFALNGVRQGARNIIDITAAQLSQLTFVAGTSVNDRLYVRAFDGQAWSAPDVTSGASLVVTVLGDDIVINGERTYTGDGTVVDNISGTGHVTFNGPGALHIVTGNLSQTGGTTLYEGALVVGPNNTNGGTTGFIAGDIVTAVVWAGGGINFNRSDDITVSGNISGLGYLNQRGLGTLTLTGNNTYSAYTSIESGTLAIASASNIGAGEIKLYNDSSILRFNASFGLAQNIQLGSGAFDTNGNNVTLSGVLSTMSGVNTSFRGGFTKLGAGTLTLTGDNTYRGRTVISAGTLQIGNGTAIGSIGFSDITDNANLTFKHSDNITVANPISGTGSLTQAGSGTITLISDKIYTGGTTITAGTILLGPGGNLASTGALAVNGGTFDLAGRNQTLGALSGTGGTIALGSGNLATVSDVNTSFAGIISGTGGLTKGGAGTLILAGNNTFTGGVQINAGTLQIGNGGASGSLNTSAIIDNGALVFNRSDNITMGTPISGSGSVTMSGSGTLTFVGGNNSYTGGTIVNDGTLRLGSGNSGQLPSGGAVTVNGGNLVLGGSVQNIGALSGTGGAIYMGNALVRTTSSANTTLASALIGPGTFVKDGTGTLTLMGASTYAGPTVVDGGTLVLGAGGSLGSTTNLCVNAGAIFNLNGHNQTVGDVSSGSAGTIMLGGGTLTTDFAGDGLLQASLTGAGNFVKAGAGTLWLQGTNTYTGTTTINGGALRIGSGDNDLGNVLGNLGSGAVINNGALIYGRRDSVTVGNAISGTGEMDIIFGSVTLTGANSYNRSIISSGSTLQVGNGGANGSLGTGDTVNNGTLIFNRAGNLTYGGAISGAGRLNLAGSGTLTLTGNNSYAGPTSVAAGTLLVDGLSGSSAVTVEAGAILGGTGTVGTTTIRSGGKLAAGDAPGNIGALHVNGNLTIQGITLTEDISATAADQIIVSGDVTLGGQLVENFAAGNYAPGNHAHRTFAILHADGNLSGTFSDVSATGLPAGVSARVTYDAHNVYLTINNAPVVTTSNINAQRSQTIAASDLFTASDPDGDTITLYEFWDENDDPGSGHFVVNGVAQAGRTLLDIPASQLSQVSFVAGNTASDAIQIRAFDGTAWSIVSGKWAPFSVLVPPPPVNHAPVVTTSNINAQRNQTIAASDLFSVSDPDSDIITLYEFWDENDDPSSGHFVVNGVAQAGRTLLDIPASQLSQVSFVSGNTAGDAIQIRAFDGTAWSTVSGKWAPFSVLVPQPPVNHAPVVTTSNINAQRNQTIAASALFTVSDPDNDIITLYEFWDENADPDSGHFVVNGVAQAGRTLIDIPASQLSQVSFVAGNSASDAIQIRAFDGTAWSTLSGKWAPFSVLVPPPPVNHAPVVTTSNISAQLNQTIAATSLFTVTDADNDAITLYEFWDENDDPNSGHFVVNGVAQAGRTLLDIPASQLSQVSFVSGKAGTTDAIQVRAFDGTAWSAVSGKWSPFSISAPPNHAPVVATSNISAQRNQTIVATSLFTVIDADNDAITLYEFWDENDDPGSGHFVVGGVAQAGRTLLDISPSQLSSVSFVAGNTASDAIQIRAFDGKAWSTVTGKWAPFSVLVPPPPVNHAPVVTTSNINAQRNQTIAASALFTVSDPDNDIITLYEFWDENADPDSGHFMVNGVAQAGRTLLDITASQLSQVSFVAGNTAGDAIQIRAFDGTAWSTVSGKWAPFAVLVPPNQKPVLTTHDITATAGQVLTTPDLFTVSDPDGDAITMVEFWDENADPSSGHFVVGGAAQAGQTLLDIPASQLSQVSFVAGSTGDALQIRAFDGHDWSAIAASKWSPFHISVA